MDRPATRAKKFVLIVFHGFCFGVQFRQEHTFFTSAMFEIAFVQIIFFLATTQPIKLTRSQREGSALVNAMAQRS